jgi:cytochrome c-type biogenesis protein CcmE
MSYLKRRLRHIDGGRIVQPALTLSANEQETIRPRKRLPFSFIIAAIAILGAVVYLVYANTQTDAVYYMTVPELKHCTTCATQAVRVAGFVQNGSIQRDDKNQSVSFVIADSMQTLPVTYRGVVPDIFRSGVQVVVEGHYTGTGPFQAQTLLAKCPSKFQSATPGAKK